MQKLKTIFFIFAATLTGACRESEDTGPIYYCVQSAIWMQDFEYDNYADNQSHHLNIMPLSGGCDDTWELKTLITASSSLDSISKLKVFNSELNMQTLSQEIIAQAQCFGPSDPITALHHSLLVSYHDLNGNYCELPLAQTDPITIKLEELYQDVMLTGDTNDVALPASSTKD